MNKADHLRNVPIFSDLSDSDLTKIALKMVPREYGRQNDTFRRKPW